MANWFPIEQRINFITSYLCATFSFGDLPENFPYACLLFICKWLPSPDCEKRWSGSNGLATCIWVNGQCFVLSTNTEKTVAYQLTVHMETNYLPSCQSGFRTFHSTEALLLSLPSNIYGAIDRSEIMLLALFDVNAALIFVEHSILLERLHSTFGLHGGFFEWFSSFLRGRTLSWFMIMTLQDPSGSLPGWSLLRVYTYIIIYTPRLSTLLVISGPKARFVRITYTYMYTCRHTGIYM